MAPKRKRKPLPKRPCPCCGSILSEKIILRHASGTHVPTRITVTLASASQAAHNHADLESSRSEASSSDEIADDLTGDFNEEQNLDAQPSEYLDADPQPSGGHENILWNSWSGRRSRVDKYESDDEENDYEENNPPPIEDPESNSDIDSGGDSEEMGTHHGLGMDDLIDEDLQRILAEFSA
jgi:hypothetical protein